MRTTPTTKPHTAHAVTRILTLALLGAGLGAACLGVTGCSSSTPSSVDGSSPPETPSEQTPTSQSDAAQPPEPPPDRNESPGVAPSVHHFWAHGYWHWDKARAVYVWTPGYWQDREAQAPTAPPAPIDEDPGLAPGAGYFYAPGYWRWSGREYHWAPGHWTTKREGYVFARPHWERNGSRWECHGSGWERRDAEWDIRHAGWSRHGDVWVHGNEGWNHRWDHGATARGHEGTDHSSGEHHQADARAERSEPRSAAHGNREPSDANAVSARDHGAARPNPPAPHASAPQHVTAPPRATAPRPSGDGAHVAAARPTHAPSHTWAR